LNGVESDIGEARIEWKHGGDRGAFGGENANQRKGDEGEQQAAQHGGRKHGNGSSFDALRGHGGHKTGDRAARLCDGARDERQGRGPGFSGENSAPAKAPAFGGGKSLERFPFERNRSNDKKSLKIKGSYSVAC
jgi:hypothetical protein